MTSNLIPITEKIKNKLDLLILLIVDLFFDSGYDCVPIRIGDDLVICFGCGVV